MYMQDLYFFFSFWSRYLYSRGKNFKSYLNETDEDDSLPIFLPKNESFSCLSCIFLQFLSPQFKEK